MARWCPRLLLDDYSAITPQLLDLARSAQAAIGPLGGFDAVPLDGLHQVKAAAVQGYRALADLAPFELAVGPLAGSAGAVRFTVTPWTQLTAIYRAVAGVHVGQSPRAEGIRPHLSIAYSNWDQPAAPVISARRGSDESCRSRPLPLTGYISLNCNGSRKLTAGQSWRPSGSAADACWSGNNAYVAAAV